MPFGLPGSSPFNALADRIKELSQQLQAQGNTPDVEVTNPGSTNAPHTNTTGDLNESPTMYGQAPRDQEFSQLFQEAHTAWANYDFRTVIRDLEAIDALAPGDPETRRLIGVSYFNLARQLDNENNFNEARQNYEYALQIEPENEEYRGWYNQLNERAEQT